MAAQPRKIVVGFDGSEAATRALDLAADLAGYGSTLSVVSVRTRDGDRGVADRAREQLLQRHVQARFHELAGEPAEQLVEKAHELDADLLVVGRPVGAKVVRRAPCDVLVVR